MHRDVASQRVHGTTGATPTERLERARCKGGAAAGGRAEEGFGDLRSSATNELAIPHANGLERLAGSPHGEHSIRVNQQHRDCFRWEAGHAYDVEATDYHEEATGGHHGAALQIACGGQHGRS